MSSLWSPFVHRLEPYTPGEQPQIPGLVKLNTNELPFGPSPKALQAMREAITPDLRLYPDPQISCLRQAIAQRENLSIDEVFVGNGSDEVLGLAFHAFFKREEPLLFPDLSYSFYPVYCRLFNIRAQIIPLREDMSVAIEDYQHPCGGVVLANPNAPTGRVIGTGDVRKLLEMHPNRVVLIDEAYVDFGAKSVVRLIAEYPNLLVVQTFSKSRGLAGLRVGFAMGQAGLIDGLMRVKDSFNSYPLDRVALAGAVAAYEDEDWFQKSTKKIIENRKYLTRGLKDIGFSVLPSMANFVYTQSQDIDAGSIARALRAKKIIVRHLKGERASAWLRITIGTDEQCAILLDALKEIMTSLRAR